MLLIDRWLHYLCTCCYIKQFTASLSIHYKTMKNSLDIDVYLEEKFVFINYHLLARQYQIFLGGDF